MATTPPPATSRPTPNQAFGTSTASVGEASLGPPPSRPWNARRIVFHWKAKASTPLATRIGAPTQSPTSRQALPGADTPKTSLPSVFTQLASRPAGPTA